jgi:hypothetical protein
MKETDIAWLAGLFDGEGCVYSCWPKKKNVRVEIAMSHLPTLQHVQFLFPGRFTSKVLGHGSLSVRPQWTWRLDTNGSRNFLRLLLPYLVTKREQARIAILMCDRSGSENLDKLAAELKEARAA